MFSSFVCQRDFFPPKQKCAYQALLADINIDNGLLCKSVGDSPKMLKLIKFRLLHSCRYPVTSPSG